MAGESYFGSSPFGGVRGYQSATVTPSVSALYMKTLNDSILQTRMFLDEVTPADWQDAQVIREINVGYHRVYTGVIEVYEDYYVSQANITTQLNKQEYTVSDGFPVERLDSSIFAFLLMTMQITRQLAFPCGGPYLRIVSRLTLRP